MVDARKGHRSLRLGRVSSSGSLYFVTICLKKGTSGLDHPNVHGEALSILKQYEASGAVGLLAVVIMPDHLHVFFRLFEPCTLEEIVRSFKGRLSPTLRTLNLQWQKGSYFDRRLRRSDSVAAVLRYMQMNPYRKGLLKTDEVWPYWHCSSEAHLWMGSDKDIPPPEWL